ncbi:MAG: gliding motility-associated C-terminal domain-containing protein [Bacteroidota bacterium]|nr:gliding motility-associated C-terminal domain-containing protein [Bacteroidota bacterium]
MRASYIIILLLFISGIVFAQTPPNITCLQVKESGGLTTSSDVTISWTPPIDLTNVEGYKILFAEDETSSFESITIDGASVDNFEVDISNFDFDANEQSIFFKMATRYNDGTLSAETNIVQTIFLKDTETVPNPSDQTIHLGWNSTKITTPPIYSINRKNGTNDWEEIAQNITAEQINDHIPFCGPVTKYRIIEYGASCNSISNTLSTDETDVTQPPIQQLDFVSVTPDGRIQFGWTKSEANDLAYYEIIRKNATGVIDSYTVDTTKTSYTTTDALGCNSLLRFLIIAVDTCDNKSPSATEEYLHSPIWLKEITFSECEKQNTISFTPYIRDHNKEIDYYQILKSNNGTVFYEIATQTTADDYTDSDITPGDSYYYRIKAHWTDDTKEFTSESCVKQIETTAIPQPEFVYTKHVSVEDKNIDISIFFDDDVTINGFNIYRDTTEIENWELISEISANGQNAGYTDYDVNTAQNSYRYKIVALDKCDKETEPITEHNISKTILLNNTSTEGKNHLSWSNYEGWEVGEYEIYRFHEGETPKLINSVAYDILKYEDTPQNTTSGSGQWHYQVKAVESGSNIYNLSLQSKSNIVITSNKTELFLPNAFAPEGKNYEFKPKWKYPPTIYSIKIYNRWGQMIFEGDNPAEGWNGDFETSPAPTGVYAYIITYTTNGEQHKKTGTITLIR